MLQGHAEWISNASFSPDGQLLASSSHDGTIKIWNQYRERGMFKLPQCPKDVASACFSPDSKTLALDMSARSTASGSRCIAKAATSLPAVDADIGCLEFQC